MHQLLCEQFLVVLLGFLVVWPGLAWRCEVVRHIEERDRSTSNSSHPLLKPGAMQVLESSLNLMVIVRKCCPPGIFSLILDLIPGLDRGARISGFDQQLQSVFRIKNMTGSQEHPKLSCGFKYFLFSPLLRDKIQFD